MTIRLVLSDVDGTLLTSDKRLTESAVRAVADLEAAGIAFAITSSRPPRGLAALVEPLRVRLPLGAFNGGMIVTPELAVEFEAAIEDRHVGPIVDDLLAGGLSVWVYQGARDWFVLDPDGPHVEREVHAVGYAPLVLDSFADLRGGVIKVVGVSDDPDTMARAEAAVRARAAESVSATRSQSYYLDVTDSRAHKGAVVRYLSARLAIPVGEIATIGDGANDLDMFAVSGVSVAMGNASDEVKAGATLVTTSHDDDGFARGVEAILAHRG
ncbi:MAG TPA: Cof-type HAD-IIB family hydrolase [Acidimicrobiales bacterium]|nr:Cof-type HAD-IIB family hydrolase [Acidimicrobiales bacterium]